MRKALALFIVIFLTFICLFTVIFIDINAEKDNVVVTETVVYGDKRYAEGVTVKADARYNGYFQKQTLQWKTDYTIGNEPITNTDFDIAFWGIKEKYESIKDISLYTTFNFSTTGDYYNSVFENIGKMYEEMMEDAEPYQEKEKTIILSDYFDFYPLYVDVNFPNYHLNTDVIFSIGELSDTEIAVAEAFNNFFKVPVIEGSTIEINAMADDDGNIFQWGTSSTDTNSFDMYVSSQVTNDKCFLSFSNRTQDGNIVDTSHIPGGYGIYCLPYSETENKVNFDFDNMKNVYPVDEENEIVEIRLTDDNKHLYIVTKEGNKTILTLMNTETYEKKLSLEIDSLENGYSYIYRVGSNFILFNTFDNDNDDNYFYTVVSIDEKGKYKKEFTVQVDYVGDIAKWDGECLYLASTTTHDESFISQPCRFNFTVYNKDGLKFHGKYDMSLATGYDGNYSSSYYVYLGHDAIDFMLPA